MNEKFTSRLSEKQQSIVLFLFAFSVRVAFDSLFFPILEPRFRLLKHDPYDLLAWNLVQGFGYVLAPQRPPVTMRLPLYPLFLAGIFEVCGRSLWITQVTQAGLDGATAVVLAAIARRLFSPRASLAAATLFALYPLSIVYAARYYSESLCTLLICLFVLAVVRLMEEQGRLRYAVLGGLALGGLGLTRVATLALPVFFLPVLLLGRWSSGSGGRKVTASAVLLLTAVLVLTPWLARNYRLTGRPFLGGVNVDVPLEAWRLQLHEHTAAPHDGGPTHVAVDSPGDQFEKNRQALSVAWGEVWENPAATAWMFSKGLFLVWFHTRTVEMEIIAGVIHGALLILAAGVSWRAWRMRSRRFPEMLFIWSVVTCFVVVHALTFPFVRYLVPVAPLVMLFAGAGLAEARPGLLSRALVHHRGRL